MKTLKIILITAALALSFQLSGTYAQGISGKVVDMYMNRYNSNTQGEKLTVNEGEILGTLHWRGWTPAAADYQTGAAIRSVVTGLPANGYLPARLNFYTGGSDIFNHMRMTILENGNIGIGIETPLEKLGVYGNINAHGTRLSLGLASSFADGGEALTHTATNGFAGLPGDVLTLNNGGGFEGGVYVDAPGLRIGGTMESECVRSEKHFISNTGNIMALGGSGVVVNCTTPGEGDFVAYGNQGDFIAHHGNFVAMNGNIEATVGNIHAGNNLQVDNDITGLGDMYITGNTNIDSDATIGGNAGITGSASIGSNATIGGNAGINGNANIGGNAEVNHNLLVKDNLTVEDKVGINTNAPTADLHVEGDVLVHNGELTADVVVITGGADLSEKFDLTTEDMELTPGMVVSIDPATPGNLMVSQEAYDKKVAGILSGAGGVETGMLMGQNGSEANGSHAVALTGRVYCLVDAGFGPIEPGDLLTTSDIFGHAMKVEDHSKAQGAIIGKAMSSLESGQGLVLVLVSLQ